MGPAGRGPNGSELPCPLEVLAVYRDFLGRVGTSPDVADTEG